MYRLVRKIDDFLNGITMYRLMLYGLGLLAIASLIFSFVGTLTIQPLDLILSLGLIMTVGFVANQGLGKLLGVPTNFESGLITCFILFFILPQPTDVPKAILLVGATVIALASKFIISPRRAHIFNPAAFGAGALALTGFFYATWWVGNSTLWPFTLILGLLVVRKLRRFSMLGSFVLVTLTTIILSTSMTDNSLAATLRLAVTSSPLIFLATIMLTEPSTTPNRLKHQIFYGGLVGLLFAGQFRIGPVYIYPEIALLIGNIYAYIVSSKQHVQLKLKSVNNISDRIRDYVFTPDKPLKHEPGQYMEWTLPITVPDGRGNRRTFTIASSPTESDIHLGVKFYEPSSKFKSILHDMKPGTTFYAGQVGGDFTLPADTKVKLALVAGGIGITPFRSMLQYITDSKQKRDIILLYSVASAEEIAFRDVFEKAKSNGVRTIPIVSGPLDADAIRKHVPDFAGRTFYISGPQGMVSDVRHTLRGLGVNRSTIKTDYFSGY